MVRYHVRTWFNVRFCIKYYKKNVKFSNFCTLTEFGYWPTLLDFNAHTPQSNSRGSNSQPTSSCYMALSLTITDCTLKFSVHMLWWHTWDMSIAPCILNRGSRWKCPVIFMARLLHTQFPSYRMLGGPQSQSKLSQSSHYTNWAILITHSQG